MTSIAANTSGSPMPSLAAFSTLTPPAAPDAHSASDVESLAVSVIVPVKNGAATIVETLLSVQHQSISNWELIVIDDGSTDDTGKLVASMAATDRRIRCFSGPARGVSAARNSGIAHARADLVAFLDADDLWEPGKLAAHIDHFAGMPLLGVSFSRVLFVDVAGRSTGVVSTPHVTHLLASDLMYENPACTASTLVIRRNLLLQVGCFDESMRYSEDLELMLRMRLLTGCEVEGLQDVLVRYRASPQGASANLEAMQSGWESLMGKVRHYAPDLVDTHLRRARATHLRYLSRRALRLGMPAAVGLSYFREALRNSPLILLRQPLRSFGTLAALCWRRCVPLRAGVQA